MKLGCIAAVQVKMLGWTEKNSKLLKKISFFFLLPPLFLLFH